MASSSKSGKVGQNAKCQMNSVDGADGNYEKELKRTQQSLHLSYRIIHTWLAGVMAGRVHPCWMASNTG